MSPGLRRKKVSDAQKEQIKQLLKKHKVQEVAVIMKVSRSSIYNIIKESQAEKLSDNPNLLKHFSELAGTAKVLAHRIKVLLQHKDRYSNLEKMGDLIMEEVFQSKGTGVLFLGPIDPLEEYRYDRESAVDPYLAKCLLSHYLSQFGKLPYAGWEELKMDSISEELRNNLLLLAHSENLQFCPNCPSCKAIMG